MSIFSMDEVYVGEMYQELLIGLNGLIEKTIEIQKATVYNSQDYREALRLQIELEKTKLGIMEMLGEGLETNLTNKELVGLDDMGNPIFEIKGNGDVRFDGKLTTEDVKETNNN